MEKTKKVYKKGEVYILRRTGALVRVVAFVQADPNNKLDDDMVKWEQVSSEDTPTFSTGRNTGFCFGKNLDKYLQSIDDDLISE